jgi:hypothetical protein
MVTECMTYERLQKHEAEAQCKGTTSSSGDLFLGSLGRVHIVDPQIYHPIHGSIAKVECHKCGLYLIGSLELYSKSVL